MECVRLKLLIRHIIILIKRRVDSLPAKSRQKGIVKYVPPKAAGKTTALKEIDKKIDEIVELFESLQPKDQIKALELMGVGSTYFTCQHCGKVKSKDKFYVTSKAGQVSGITDGCKQCAEEIAMPIVNGERQQPTKQTVDDAMYFLDKPMLDSIWEGSLLEAANESAGNQKSNVYKAYAKNMQLPQYIYWTYRNSDNYTGGALSLEDMAENALPKDQEIIEQFEKNKSDTLRLLGYLPFEKEKLSDQPFLYSQLIGFLDSSEEGNDDMMRIASIISIVRGFLQASNIDDMVAQLSQDHRNAEKNIATIKALQSMKSQILGNVNNLAKESCISLKNSRHSIRGENTWTGKMKKIEDLKIREYEVNGYDIETCKAMRQVSDISVQSIINALSLDESEWSDMVADQTKKIYDLQQERDGYQEASRILLKENLDFRDKFQLLGVDIANDSINLNELVNKYFSVKNDNIVADSLIEDEIIIEQDILES